MRPETIITLNKPSFRADEPITGFVDIDTNQSEPGTGKMEDKLWVVKVRLSGYAQMDTQWEDHARSANWHEKARYETLPVEDQEVSMRSTDVPVYVKPGVATRVRSIPFRIQLSPETIISSYNAQKGLFLVDYILTATTKRKCPQTGWLLLKLETRTFVTITPPEREIERPLQVTPYSPPLDEMDLFRVPFMQTIRFNYSSALTPTTLSPSHKMSIYFPLPLYEPEDISISLTSTLTLRYHQIVNRHTDNTELRHQVYYRPDTGGEEVSVEFDVPATVPQTMDFKFAKGSMNMSHTLRVTMQVKLFPGDKAKCTKKNWSVDLPVMIRGRHYPVNSPAQLSPSLTRSSPTSPEETRTSLRSNKVSDTSEVSWIQERFSMATTDDEETAPPSATVSATSSFGPLSAYSEATETSSVGSSKGRSSSESPTRRRHLRVVNEDAVPPQKPAPTGPLPQPPGATRSATSSPVLQHRTSPTQTRPTTATRAVKKHSPDNPAEYPLRKSQRGRTQTREDTQPSRSRSTPATKDFRPDISAYDPFLVPKVPPMLVIPAEPVPNPPSASSVSTKSSMPPTPTSPPALPAYYGKHAPKIPPRGRSKSFGNTMHSPVSPTSPGPRMASPPASPPSTMSRVKFNPEVSLAPSPLPTYPIPQNQPVRAPRARTPPLDRIPLPPSQPVTRSPPQSRSTIPSTSQGRRPSPPESRYTVPSTSSPLSSPTHPRLPLSSRQLLPPSPARTTTSHSTPSQLPVPRPPLPSQSKDRITSMSTATTTTTRTNTSHIPSISTATSRSNESHGTRVHLRKRPAAPSLFPPLPPATLAVQREHIQAARKVTQTGHTADQTPRAKYVEGQGNTWL